MGWSSVGSISVSRNWQFTDYTEAEIFRISHLTTSTAGSVRAVVAQGFLENGKPVIFNPKIIVRREEIEVFALYFPVGIALHSFGIKSLDNLESTWIIDVEIWTADNPVEDFSNYLIARFGPQIQQELKMTLYPIGSAEEKKYSLAPKYKKIELEGYVPQLIVDANGNRGQLTVRTGMHGIMLATGFDMDGEPVEIITEVPPNWGFDLPSTDNAVYQGEIWAKSYAPTYINFTEYSFTELGKDGQVDPVGEQSSDEEPAGEQPSDEEPAGEQPAGEQPAG